MVCGTRPLICFLPVKIDAVGTGVRKNAVQNNADAQEGCTSAQRLKIRNSAQNRIDAEVIGGVVSMVGSRFKDRIQIHDTHAETLQISEGLFDALQGPPEVITGIVVFFSRQRGKKRSFFPFIMIKNLTSPGAVILDAFFRRLVIAAPESIREDLVHHALLKPRRHLEPGIVNRELIRRRRRAVDTAHSPGTASAGAVIAEFATDFDRKIIPVHAGRDRCIDLHLPVFIRLPEEIFLASPLAKQKQINALHVLQSCAEAQSQRCSGGYRPDRITEFTQG